MALVRGFFGELQAATRDLTCVISAEPNEEPSPEPGLGLLTTIPSTCLSLGLIASSMLEQCFDVTRLVYVRSDCGWLDQIMTGYESRPSPSTSTVVVILYGIRWFCALQMRWSFSEFFRLPVIQYTRGTLTTIPPLHT